MKNKLSFTIVLASLLFLAACADSGSSGVEDNVQTTAAGVSTSRILRIAVRDKEPVCVKVTNNSVKVPHDGFRNELALSVIDGYSCDNALSIQIPGVAVSRSVNRFIPAVNSFPSNWTTPDFYYGSCSLEIMFDQSRIYFIFDICRNQLVDSERSFSTIDSFSLDEMEVIKVQPTIVTDIDQHKQKKTHRAMALFTLKVIESIEGKIEVTESRENMLWNEALNESLLEDVKNEN